MSYLRCVSIAMQEEYDGRCKDTLYRFSSYRSWYMNQAIAASVACSRITLLIVIGAVTGALLWGRGQFGAIMATMEGFYEPAWASLSHCAGVIALQCTHADAMANAGSFSDRTCGYGSSSLSLAHRCFALCLFQCLPPSNQCAVQSDQLGNVYAIQPYVRSGFPDSQGCDRTVEHCSGVRLDGRVAGQESQSGWKTSIKQQIGRNKHDSS